MPRPSLLLFALVLSLLGTSVAGAQDASAPIRVIELDGPVDLVAARFITTQIDDAEAARAPAIVIRIDTPGGLVSAAREIVSAMEESTVPVAVWVGPSPARAGSAGAYISAAADHLGMSPGTNIGSATPISSGGADLTTKVRNDFAASIAALASEHGRDPAPYRAMVTDALNLTVDEALAQGVIETVQPTLAEFAAWLDGRRGADGLSIRATNAPLEIESLPWHLRVLRVVTDPNLVFLLLLLGMAGLALEAFHPGAILPGLTGAISLVLALAGLTVLPFNWTGLALVVLGVGLFAAEIQVGGLGVLTVGGVACLALGGMFLIDSSDPGLTTSPVLAVVMALLAAAAFVASARLVLRAQRRPIAVGGTELVGEIGHARGSVGPGGGQVAVNGEIWSAHTVRGADLPSGTAVRVVRVHPDDLTLTVEPKEG